MDNRRWSNITANRQSYDRADGIAGDAPIEAFFEVAARCNLHCQMCAINFDSRYKPRSGRPPFFEPDLFSRLRPIFPSLHRAYLFGLGEPTLNKHLPDFIRELSSHGVEVWFNTNATLIDDARAEELAAAGAERITVSIDGATAETYETIRRGAKFEAVIRGIRALVDAGRRHGRPRVNLSFVAMKSNLHEIPALIELCAELGAYGVHIEPLYFQGGSPDLIDHYDRENLGSCNASRFFDVAQRRAGELGLQLGTRFKNVEEYDFVEAVKKERPSWMCSEPWSSIWVTSAGEVRTCCTNDVMFGNLFEESIGEIWNGERFRRFREQHARHEIAEGCNNCMLNGRVRNSPFFRATERVTYAPFPIARAEGDPIITFHSPRAGDTVTDPLIISGTAHIDPLDIELVINDVPVANLHDAGWFDGANFVAAIELPFLSEGAHILSAQRRGEHAGYEHRQLFFRRGVESAAHTIDALFFAEPMLDPSLLIGGLEWNDVTWRTMSNPRGISLVAHADLRRLPPGGYTAVIQKARVPLAERALVRLPV